MEKQTAPKKIPQIPFDPGFYKFNFTIPENIDDFLQEIRELKQHHQKKFAFSKLEGMVFDSLKSCASFYLGCIIWASLLSFKYSNPVHEITGNPALKLSDEDKKNLNYCEDIGYILDIAEKTDKSSQYYLNRKSRIPREFEQVFHSYKEFAQLNDNFKNLKYTNEIKIPECTVIFELYSLEKLQETEQKLKEIIASGNMHEILEFIPLFYRED